MIKTVIALCTLLSLSIPIVAQQIVEQVRYSKIEQVRKRGLPPLRRKRGQATLPDLFHSEFRGYYHLPYSHLHYLETTQLSLQDLVNRAAKTTLDRFAEKKLREDQLSITLIDMRDPARPVTASFRGNERVYPASVVKLFYLVAAHRLLEDKTIEPTPELTRALRDMIVDSSNEATQYVLDVLTHTTGGYELPPKEMEEWQYKRNAINRYFTSMGYTNINVNQKTFCEDAYGREKISRGPNGENRNKLTTDATARLMMEIVTGKVANPTRTTAMMELLKRDYSKQTSDTDDQGRGFTGMALQGREGFRLWSKAGWTSTTRHDVAYIEMPDGGKFVLAIFTTDHSVEREIIPTVARVVIDGLKEVK